MLTPEEMKRYSRHLILPEIGEQGQERLKNGAVLLVGAGGLGAPAALYLAAAGVGRLGVIDFDAVDETNLQRQVIFGTSDAGRPKAEAAAERLRDLNPHIEVTAHGTRLDAENAIEIVGRYDVVLDGSDNFAAKYLVNDACVLSGKPDVYGSVLRFEGQASVFGMPGKPCYRCLYPEPPPPDTVPDCASAGVLGALPGVIGSIQALEAVKIIVGRGDTLAGRLLLLDALSVKFREIAVPPNPDCPLCGPDPTITGLVDYERLCSAGTDTKPLPEIEPVHLKKCLDSGADLQLVDVRDPWERRICSIGGTLVPMDRLTEIAPRLDPKKPTVVYCHVGVRSAFAVRYLLSIGFEDVRNLRGGIDAWSIQVDPSQPTY